MTAETIARALGFVDLQVYRNDDGDAAASHR